jgi:histidyl-tRNA synthetase
MIRSVRGTKDLFREQFQLHEEIISVAQQISSHYGFERCSVPIIEYSEVFSRALGGESDLVNKEMYTFLDRSGEKVTLRPEFTAGIMRAVVTGNYCDFPLRLCSHGPLFRYDRPQAGRQRQFNQINFEHIGVAGPFADAEMIKMSWDIMKALGVLEKINLRINSLGCKESRNAYRKALVVYLQKRASELSEESRAKILFNPLRILDSKHPLDQSVINEAPSIEDYYTDVARNHWNLVKEYLNNYGINYVVDSKLVRGLDYYTHTVFEFSAESLSAQSGVLGGGRYDGLAFLMFEKNLPAVGCAIGVERIALLLNQREPSSNSVVLIPIDTSHLQDAVSLAQQLRCSTNFPVMIELEGTLKLRMKKANKQKARYVIFLGPKESASKAYTLRDLMSGEELLLGDKELINHLSNVGDQSF